MALRPEGAGQEFVPFQVAEPQTGRRPRSDPDLLRIRDQELVFSGGCREHGCAVVAPDAQVSPLPVTQGGRGRVKLAGGIGDFVLRECGNRGRDAGPVGVSRVTAYRQWNYAWAPRRCAIGGDAPEW